MYYKNGKVYAWWNNDGVWGLSLLTEQGAWEEHIELGEMDTHYYCADGIVFAKNTSVSATEKYGEYHLYDWDLSYIKSYETQGRIGQLWGETEKFVYYNIFVYDKDKDVYYGTERSDWDQQYQNYIKVDGVFYNSAGGDIYAFEPYTIVKES